MSTVGGGLSGSQRSEHGRGLISLLGDQAHSGQWVEGLKGGVLCGRVWVQLGFC